MSDAPVRTITGLKPRSGNLDLSRLQRRNRSTPTEQEVTAPAPQEASTVLSNPAGERVPNLQVAATPIQEPHATPDVVTVRPALKSESERPGRLSTYLSMDTLERARATYRATGHLENDRIFSEFL
jgi:hypothetical protein